MADLHYYIKKWDKGRIYGEFRNPVKQLMGRHNKKLDFDLLNNRIFLSLEVLENGNVNSFNVTFVGVSSHYFLRNNGEERFSFYKIEDEDYLELTSIDYFEKGVGNIVISSTKEE